MQEDKKIPLFNNWAAWYIAVLVLHAVGIVVYMIVTNTFTP